MPEHDQRNEQQAEQKKKLWSTKHTTAFALVGIFVVLVLSNLNAIFAPLKRLNSILAPITVGLVLAYILNFFVRFFEYKLFNKVKRRMVSRVLSMLCSYLVLLVILAGIVWLVIPSVVDSVRDLQANGLSYVTRVIDLINDVVSHIPFVSPEDGTDFLNLEKLLNLTLQFLGSSGTWILTNLATIAGGTLTAIKNVIVGIFISIYVLLSKERLNAGCRRVIHALFSEKTEKRLHQYFSTAHSKFGGYMIGKLADSTMVMLVCMLLFSIFDIPYAILIAVIIGVTDIIPFFGPFIGAIPSALIIFIASPSKAFLFVLLILVVQQIDGNLIAPVILGDRTGLSSLGVIVAVTVMGGLLGIAGMLIGVPLFALIMTLLDDFIKSRLVKKGAPTKLSKYYPADAFLRPSDQQEDHLTLTQRFVLWVKSVEKEKNDPNRSKTFLRRCSHNLRRGLYEIGNLFYRLFTVKPIPEDRKNVIYKDIITHGMRTDRVFWPTFFLSIVTLGIYPLYMTEIISKSTNIACRKDGKRTWGFFPYLLLAIFTLGIFPLIWHAMVLSRIRRYCKENGVECVTTHKFFLCWALIGLPIIVGPFIALAAFLRAFSQMCSIYNATHTFPLSAEEIEEEERLHQHHMSSRKRRRLSIIEELIAPMDLTDEDEETNEGEETDEGDDKSPVTDQ